MGTNSYNLSDKQLNLVIMGLKLLKHNKLNDVNMVMMLYPDFNELGNKEKTLITQSRYNDLKEIEDTIEHLQNSWKPLE